LLDRSQDGGIPSGNGAPIDHGPQGFEPRLMSSAAIGLAANCPGERAGEIEERGFHRLSVFQWLATAGRGP
jgi:hypothetical protein